MVVSHSIEFFVRWN